MTHTRAPFTWDWDAPTASAPPQPAPRPFEPAPSGTTPWVWTLAVSPYIWGVIAGVIDGIWLVLTPESERVSIAFLAFGVSAIVGLVPLWVFAWLDTRALEHRGLRAPSILWMLLLPPVAYFLARRSVLRHSGARWLGPQITLAVIVGSQVLSGVVSLLLGGVALIATLATGPGALSGPGAMPALGGSEYGYGVNTVQDNDLGWLSDGGSYGAQVEQMLAAAYGLTPQTGVVDCTISGVEIIATSTFPCTIASFDDQNLAAQVSVTVASDGAVSYTELPR